MHGVFAKAAISCVAELLPLAPTGELHPGTPELLRAAHAVCTGAMTGPPPGLCAYVCCVCAVCVSVRVCVSACCEFAVYVLYVGVLCVNCVCV